MLVSERFLERLGVNLFSSPEEYYESLIDPVIDISDSIYISDSQDPDEIYEQDFELNSRVEVPMASTFKQEVLDEISSNLEFSLGKVMVH